MNSYNEFIEYITENGLPDIISFDHDLADNVEPQDSFSNVVLSDGKEKTGFDCAKWLVNYCMDNDEKLPEYVVHSANPAGTENIQGLLNNFKENQ